MTKFIKGLDLNRGFFIEEVKPIMDKYFPDLDYSAGLIGYGSDVLGYDDVTSTDHMWGPRLYMFLDTNDILKKDRIFKTLSEKLPYCYCGYSVNYTEPDPNDNGVQHPMFIDKGTVNPLIFIKTFDEFLLEELGIKDFQDCYLLDWLSFSEHRLLSLVSGTLFIDKLNIKDKLEGIKYYPKEIKLYLIASNWDIIASEQAFVKRCSECNDEIGSMIVCSRIAERLMRLCFIYKETYAPYSKWFGTAFSKLDIDEEIKSSIKEALCAQSADIRENSIVKAQALVAKMHNESKETEYIPFEIESYYGRDIKVIFADKFAESALKKLQGTLLEDVPLIGTFSEMGGLSNFSDDKNYACQIKRLYLKDYSNI